MDTATRNRHLAHVHATAKALELEGEKYKAWLKRRTGKASCADLSDTELSALVDSLKASLAQWQTVSQLTRELGYSGFEDERFRTIVQRVTKTDDARLLSRPQLGKLTAVLVKAVESRRKRALTPPTDAPDHHTPAEGSIHHVPKEKAPTVASGQGLSDVAD